MTSVGWSLVDVVSQLLEHQEREAVQGDLAEAGESAWQGLLAVMGLVIRRETALWSNWRPWLAAFGIAAPCSFLLMGLSVAVSRSFIHLIDATTLPVSQDIWRLLSRVLLLTGSSWAGGFVLGSLSRRTLWVSAALSFSPCLFCLTRFRIESLSRYCLLLFLLPAILGVWRGLRFVRIALRAAIILAIGLTVLSVAMWSKGSPWLSTFAITWPAWCLVATARSPGNLGRD